MKKLALILGFLSIMVPMIVWPAGRSRNFQPRVAYTNSFSVSASDTFNRSDADPLATSPNMTGSSGVWTDGPGAWGACKIVAFGAIGSGGTADAAKPASPTFPENQAATITLTTGGLALSGVATRMQAGANGSCYLAAIDTTTQISVYRVDDTGTLAFVLLGAAFTVATLVDGDLVTLESSGTGHTLKINGASQGTRSDSTYSAGQPAMVFFGFASGINAWSATGL